MKQSILAWEESRWRVLQPAIYLISVLPALVCALTLLKPHTKSSAFTIFLLGLSVVLIQHAINVFNDETDWKKGADGEKKESWYHFHQGNLPALKIHAWLSLLTGTFLGVSQVFLLGRLEVFFVALPLLLLGIFYNHSKWTLSYTQWGEWVTGLCYGPGVFGCMAYLISPQFSPSLVVGSVSFSFLAVAVLLSHQPPQVLTDFAAGKLSFAVRYGAEKTYRVARLLTLMSLLGLLFLLIPAQSSYFVMGSLGAALIGLLVFLPRRLNPGLILKAAALETVILGPLLLWGTA